MTVGTVVGLVLILASALIFYFWRDKKAVKEVTDKESGPATNKKSSSSFPFVLLYNPFGKIPLLILLGVFLYALYTGYNDSKNKSIGSSQSTSVGVGLIDMRSIEDEDDGPVLQIGMLSWYKPTGVNGGNPQLRKFSSKVEVMRNDSQEMVFVVKYSFNGGYQKARFQWNKQEPFGTWSQSYPQDGGRWQLNKVSDSMYDGDHSDKHGSVIPIRLELL